MEDMTKLQDWEKDLVYMKNIFKIRTKEGKIIEKSYDLVVFGGHNNLPYSAVALLVSLPCAITTQLILDGKIKERGVLMPTSDIIIETVLKEMEKEKIFITEEVVLRAKF